MSRPTTDMPIFVPVTFRDHPRPSSDSTGASRRFAARKRRFHRTRDRIWSGWSDREAGASRSASALLGEEELDLALGGGGRVRAVHQVLHHGGADVGGQVAADGPGRGLDRVGGAGEGAEGLDAAVPLD